MHFAQHQVKIDEYKLLTDGIKIEGVITADALYISSNDTHPVNSTFLMFPFQYVIEMPGIHEQANYEVTASLEQITINLIDTSEFEIKATVNLCAIAFENKKGYVIQELSLSALDSEKMQNLPGMVGYIVKEGDTLWDIAKQYYTTVDSIVRCNHLESEELHDKDKLLIVK